MKDYRNKEMLYLLAIYVLIYWMWFSPIYQIEWIDNELAENILSIIKSTIVTGIVSLLIFLCDCIIDSSLKNKLVGLFFIPLSGETIFTRIKEGRLKDVRIDMEYAREVYKSVLISMPSNKKQKRYYENAAWYAIYDCHRSLDVVQSKQRDYLVCRDLYIESIMFLLLYLVGSIVISDIIAFSWLYIGVIALFTIVLLVATHVRMNRFVCTVIARDLAHCKNEK